MKAIKTLSIFYVQTALLSACNSGGTGSSGLLQVLIRLVVSGQQLVYQYPQLNRYLDYCMINLLMSFYDTIR